MQPQLLETTLNPTPIGGALKRRVCGVNPTHPITIAFTNARVFSAAFAGKKCEFALSNNWLFSPK